MKKDYRLQIQCDCEMEKWLKKRAKRLRCSMAHVIRQMILQEMEKK